MLLPRGAFPGYTKDRLKGQYYFTVDSAADLDASWPAILKLRPDFVKTILWFSEEFYTRRMDPAFNGQKGLNPALLARIVAKAHENRLRALTASLVARSGSTDESPFLYSELDARRPGYSAMGTRALRHSGGQSGPFGRVS